MRTTYTPTPDVAAEIRRLRSEQGIGTSEAINQLARLGMAANVRPQRFRQRSARMSARLDVTNIGEVLAILDDT